SADGVDGGTRRSGRHSPLAVRNIVSVADAALFRHRVDLHRRLCSSGLHYTYERRTHRPTNHVLLLRTYPSKRAADILRTYRNDLFAGGNSARVYLFRLWIRSRSFPV